MNTEAMKNRITEALEEIKVRDLVALDVRDKSSFTDYMLVGSGTSNRHLKALIDHVEETLSADGTEPLGREGGPGSEWVLLDYGVVIVHMMLPETRHFYDLEQLWSGASPDNATPGSHAP